MRVHTITYVHSVLEEVISSLFLSFSVLWGLGGNLPISFIKFWCRQYGGLQGNSIAPSCCNHFRSLQLVLILNRMGQDRARVGGNSL